MAEIIAPKVGGVTASDGKFVEAHHMIDGGPSVLFDAVALLTSPEGIDDLVKEATARDFVADAFQHCKFIGYHESAVPLLQKAGVANALDEGIVALPADMDVSALSTNSANCASGPRALGEARNASPPGT